MNLFKSYTYSWQQIGVFKLALLSIGAAIGAYWAEFFMANMIYLLGVAVLTSAYIMYISIKQ